MVVRLLPRPQRTTRLWVPGDPSGLPRNGLVAQWDFAIGWTPLVGSFAVQNGSTAGVDTNDGTLTAGYGLLCEADYALSDALTGIDLAGSWTLGCSLISNGTTPGLVSTLLSLAQADAEDNYVAIETSPPTFSTGAEAEAIKHCNVRLHVKNGATDTYSEGAIFLATSMVRSILLEANGNVLTLSCRETGESCTVTAARASAVPRIGWGVCAKATLASPVVSALYKETCLWNRDLSAVEDARAKNQLRSRWRSLDPARASYLTMAELEDELTTQVKAKLSTGFSLVERNNWTNMIEDYSSGKNTVLWVSDGAETPKYFPSVMVVIPQFTCGSVLEGAGTAPHPAFTVGSTTYDNLYIAKYQACFVESNSKFLPLSLRGVDPAAGSNSYKTLNGNALPNSGRLNFDDAWTFCKNLGTGWHCMTNAEWAAVALLTKAAAFNPRGNNSNGKDANVPSERGVPSYWYDSAGTKYIGRVRTGTGPVGWSHDGTPFGIADLNGNILEWNPGWRQFRGEIHISANNDMADTTNLVTPDSPAWKAVLQDGTLVETVWRTGWTPAENTLLSVWDDTAADWRTYKCTTSGAVGETAPTWYADSAWAETVTDGAAVWTLQTGDANKTLKLQPATATAGPLSLVLDVTVRTTASVGVQFKDIVTSGVTVPNILKLLGIVPDGSAYTYGNDYLYWRNDLSGSYAETLARRGGGWYYGTGSGVFYAGLYSPRSGSGDVIGCRPAFVGEVA
jgi:hypothetical protein